MSSNKNRMSYGRNFNNTLQCHVCLKSEANDAHFFSSLFSLCSISNVLLWFYFVRYSQLYTWSFDGVASHCIMYQKLENCNGRKGTWARKLNRLCAKTFVLIIIEQHLISAHCVRCCSLFTVHCSRINYIGSVRACSW